MYLPVSWAVLVFLQRVVGKRVEGGVNGCSGVRGRRVVTVDRGDWWRSHESMYGRYDTS